MDRKTERLLNDFREPDDMPLQEILDRLDARDKYPAEYLKAKDRHESLKRDEQDRTLALDSWMRNGGDPKIFDKEWKAISTEAQRLRMEEEQREARVSFARYGRESF